MATKFGDLVKAKLIEQKISAAVLSNRIGKSRSYMTYVISGTNPSARRRTFIPGEDVILRIAKELHIPVEEAFEAADMPVPRLPDDLAANTPAKPTSRPPATPDNERLLEIATRGALEALRMHASGGAPVEKITVSIGADVQVMFSGANDLTNDEIDRVKRALEKTYQKVRQQIAEARTK